jgi:hypothetical protein
MQNISTSERSSAGCLASYSSQARARRQDHSSFPAVRPSGSMHIASHRNIDAINPSPRNTSDLTLHYRPLTPTHHHRSLVSPRPRHRLPATHLGTSPSSPLPAMKPVVSAMNAWTWCALHTDSERAKKADEFQHCPVCFRRRDPLDYRSAVQGPSTRCSACTSACCSTPLREPYANSVQAGSHEMMGGEEDPKDGEAVAGAVFGAVFIYIVCLMFEGGCIESTANVCQGFLVFCGFQAFLHNRESRRGAISLS